MPVFCIGAVVRYKASSETAVRQITDAIISTPSLKEAISTSVFTTRWDQLQESHARRLESISQEARPEADETYNAAFLAKAARKICPADTIWVIEAVTNATTVASQIQATTPGSWINCGGGGPSWSGGGALGVKLASDFETNGKGKFVCQIVGYGTYMFSVPGTVYWIAQRYNIPVLTIVLNNKGWNAPRHSMLLVHPDGEGSKMSNEELNISFGPTPDYSGIARAASGGRCWSGIASTASKLEELLPLAVKAVQSGKCAVLDAHLGDSLEKFDMES